MAFGLSGSPGVLGEVTLLNSSGVKNFSELTSSNSHSNKFNKLHTSSFVQLKEEGDKSKDSDDSDKSDESECPACDKVDLDESMQMRMGLLNFTDGYLSTLGSHSSEVFPPLSSAPAFWSDELTFTSFIHVQLPTPKDSYVLFELAGYVPDEEPELITSPPDGEAPETGSHPALVPSKQSDKNATVAESAPGEPMPAEGKQEGIITLVRTPEGVRLVISSGESSNSAVLSFASPDWVFSDPSNPESLSGQPVPSTNSTDDIAESTSSTTSEMDNSADEEEESKPWSIDNKGLFQSSLGKNARLTMPAFVGLTVGQGKACIYLVTVNNFYKKKNGLCNIAKTNTECPHAAMENQCVETNITPKSMAVSPLYLVSSIGRSRAEEDSRLTDMFDRVTDMLFPDGSVTTHASLFDNLKDSMGLAGPILKPLNGWVTHAEIFSKALPECQLWDLFLKLSDKAIFDVESCTAPAKWTELSRTVSGLPYMQRKISIKPSDASNSTNSTSTVEGDEDEENSVGDSDSSAPPTSDEGDVATNDDENAEHDKEEDGSKIDNAPPGLTPEEGDDKEGEEDEEEGDNDDDEEENGEDEEKPADADAEKTSNVDDASVGNSTSTDAAVSTSDPDEEEEEESEVASTTDEASSNSTSTDAVSTLEISSDGRAVVNNNDGLLHHNHHHHKKHHHNKKSFVQMDFEEPSKKTNTKKINKVNKKMFKKGSKSENNETKKSSKKHHHRIHNSGKDNQLHQNVLEADRSISSMQNSYIRKH